MGKNKIIEISTEGNYSDYSILHSALTNYIELKEKYYDKDDIGYKAIINAKKLLDKIKNSKNGCPYRKERDPACSFYAFNSCPYKLSDIKKCKKYKKESENET